MVRTWKVGLSPAVLNLRCHATPSPPSPPKLPRSPVELPRSSDELPRWVFKLPRSGLKVPRSVSVLPRFAAMPAFAFPHLTGLFSPVAAFCRDPRFRALHFMGVFTPVAAPPRRIRASLGPARFTRASLEAKPRSPIAPLPRFAAMLGFAFCRGPRFHPSRYFAKCLDSPRPKHRTRRARRPHERLSSSRRAPNGRANDSRALRGSSSQRLR